MPLPAAEIYVTRAMMLAHPPVFYPYSLPGVILLALRIKSRKDPIPFGPALVIATALVVLGGTGVYSWYLNLFRFGN